MSKKPKPFWYREFVRAVLIYCGCMVPFIIISLMLESSSGNPGDPLDPSGWAMTIVGLGSLTSGCIAIIVIMARIRKKERKGARQSKE